jgi:uroporphyrinogen-III decarboxylase
MSFERGWQAINLQMPEQIPHTEYISHRSYILKVTGIDPEEPGKNNNYFPKLAEKLDYDFIWSTYSRDWKLPRTDMGRAQFYESETPWHSEYPFNTVEEVLNFNPLDHAEIPSIDELTNSVREYYQKGLSDFPEAVFPGGFYNSIFTWNIVTFGWELFLCAAKENPVKFRNILDQFEKITSLVVQAHINAGVKVFLCHDDIVWSSGPVFSPEWMKDNIFPRLKRIWTPLKESGIKIMYCSDGNLNEFLDDIADAGADGFIFEPVTDLKTITERYGKTHAIIGNIDSRILQFESKESIRNEVKRCAQLGKKCPGYFFAVGNHIPYTIPIENVECYMECIKEFGKR